MEDQEKIVNFKKYAAQFVELMKEGEANVDLKYDYDSLVILDGLFDEFVGWKEAQGLDRLLVLTKVGTYLGESINRIFNGSWVIEKIEGRGERWGVKIGESCYYPLDEVDRRLKTSETGSIINFYKKIEQDLK